MYNTEGITDKLQERNMDNFFRDKMLSESDM